MWHDPTYQIMSGSEDQRWPVLSKKNEVEGSPAPDRGQIDIKLWLSLGSPTRYRGLSDETLGFESVSKG